MKMSYSQYDALKAKGYDDEQIATLAERNGVELPSEGILGSIAKSLVVKPAVRTGQAIGAGIAGLMGASRENIIKAAEKDVDIGGMRVEGQKQFGQGGGKQIAGQALEAASFYAPYGRVAGGIASKVPSFLGKRASQAIGLGGAGALGGYAGEKGYELQEGQTDLSPGATTAIATGIAASIPFLGPLARNAIKYSGKGAKSFVAGLSSLDQSTIETAFTRPQELSAAQRNAMSRQTFVENIQTNFKAAMDNLSSTGQGYNTLKQSGGRVAGTADTFNSFLKRNNLAMDPKGNIIVGKEAPALGPEDIAQLERFFVRFGGDAEMSVNQYLNGRQMLDQFSNWSATKTDVGDALIRQLRKDWDRLGGSIKGLKEVDAQYSPLKKMIEDVRRRAFDKQGNLVEGGASYIANLAKETNFIRAQKFEKLMPGITQQAQILSAIEDIAKAGGVKVGGYMRTGAVGAGFLFGGGPTGAIMTFMATHPATIIPLVKTFGKLNQVKQSVVNGLSKKLKSGAPLSTREQAIVRLSVIEHLKNISPGDQFLDSQMGQAAMKFNQEQGGKMGMSIQATGKGMTPVEDVVSRLTMDQLKTVREAVEAGVTKGEMGAAEYTQAMKKLMEEFRQMDIDFPTKPDELKGFLREIVGDAEYRGAYKKLNVESADDLPLGNGTFARKKLDKPIRLKGALESHLSTYDSPSDGDLSGPLHNIWSRGTIETVDDLKRVIKEIDDAVGSGGFLADQAYDNPRLYPRINALKNTREKLREILSSVEK